MIEFVYLKNLLVLENIFLISITFPGLERERRKRREREKKKRKEKRGRNRKEYIKEFEYIKLNSIK